MISRLRLAIGATLLTTAVTPATGRPGQTPAPTAPPASNMDPREVVRAFDGLEPYLPIVASYRTGQPAAVAAVRRLKAAALAGYLGHLKALTPQLALPPAPPFHLDVMDLEAAVVLHTDAALSDYRDGKRDEGEVQLTHAHELMTLLTTAIDESARPGRTPLAARKDVIGARDWHLSVILVLTGMRETTKADYFSADALSQFPNDAELLLAAGTIKEELANAYDRAAEYQIGGTSTERYRGGVMRARSLSAASRTSAVTHYTNALAADPALHEAAIRRSRVLGQQGKWPEARASIAAVIEAITAPPLLYLAQLFLGRIAEAEGRLGDAVLAYRRAAMVQRASQSARVALSHALERAGVADEALEVISPLLTLPSPREYEEDPWWEYPRGRYRQGLRILETLFQRVRKASS